MFKRIFAALLCSVITVSVCSSCGDVQKKVSYTAASGSNTTSQDDQQQTAASAEPSKTDTEIKNYTAPEKGEKIVVMKIKDYGEVKFKLFPEYAEKGVENFLGLIDKNYYDGVIFHRIISDFMIQGGDPEGTGRGGASIWGEKFDGGTDPHLIHCPGALAYANSGSTATNGSQFYIVTASAVNENYLDSISSQTGHVFPEEAKKIYTTIGGTPWLDGGYTVFGQVIDGLDIIFKLQNVPTGANDKPVEDVVIESVKVVEYDGEEIKWYITDYSEKTETTSEENTEETSEEDTEASSEENNEDDEKKDENAA